ncbi:MAG: DUF1838 family protein [Rhodospirillaceae bacterium]|nr:DUF1838 family protein [Rhodospirillaceae bacterium]
MPSLITSAEAATPKFDPSNPEHVALAYRKLGWSATEKLSMHWINLTRYGMVDSKLTTLWESVIGILFFTTDIKDAPGDYNVTSCSLSFYLDPKTNAPMDKFTNPYTGTTLDIPYGDGKPNTRRQKATGMDVNMKAPPGMKAGAESFRKAWNEGDEVWVRGDLDIRMEAVGEQKVSAAMGAGGSGTRGDAPQMTRLMQVNDWFTYHGKTTDVLNPKNTNPASDLYFNDLNTWSGWLKMGDMPGNFIGRGFGRKVFAYDDMPETWRKLVAQRYPDVAKNPDKWVRG